MEKRRTSISRSTWYVRGSSTGETRTTPPTIITREVSGNVANDAAVYAVVNLTPYNYVNFDYSVYYVSPYATGMVGIGDFDTYGINGGWPTVTGIGWIQPINTYHNDPNGQGWGNGSCFKAFYTYSKCGKSTKQLGAWYILS